MAESGSCRSRLQTANRNCTWWTEHNAPRSITVREAQLFALGDGSSLPPDVRFPPPNRRSDVRSIGRDPSREPTGSYRWKKRSGGKSPKAETFPFSRSSDRFMTMMSNLVHGSREEGPPSSKCTVGIITLHDIEPLSAGSSLSGIMTDRAGLRVSAMMLPVFGLTMAGNHRAMGQAALDIVADSPEEYRGGNRKTSHGTGRRDCPRRRLCRNVSSEFQARGYGLGTYLARWSTKPGQKKFFFASCFQVAADNVR